MLQALCGNVCGSGRICTKNCLEVRDSGRGLLLCRCADGCTQLLFVQPTKQSHSRCEKVCSKLCVGMCAGVEGFVRRIVWKCVIVEGDCFFVVARMAARSCCLCSRQSNLIPLCRCDGSAGVARPAFHGRVPKNRSIALEINRFV